jgi:acetolactate synthase-1/2/3 large subunit
MKQQTGARRIVQGLLTDGVRCVFGLPGTQTTELFETLRITGLRTVLATSELGAAFMAGGWARVTGEPGVLLTIGGPGFTLALTGVAEARLDSIPLLHIAGAPPTQPAGRRFRLQELAQTAIAESLVKSVIDAGLSTDPGDSVLDSLRCAGSGEPGPVLLHVSMETLTRMVTVRHALVPGARSSNRADASAVCDRVRASRRPIFLVGQGALAQADCLREVAERLGAPVITTPSGRGLLPEDHPLNLGFDQFSGEIEELNALLTSADLIVVIGAKLGHNGTTGFNLRLSKERLVHVDASAEIIGANYPVSLGVAADAGDALIPLRNANLPASAWTADELDAWRRRIRCFEQVNEPRVAGTPAGDARSFFEALRRSLPADAIVVLDSGTHQILARRYYKVLAPGGLIFPSDLQSMGFGIPTAIGACIGAPKRVVVAVVGDGGFAMTGMELLSAAREGVSLVVIVFVDGALGQIRFQQLAEYGATHAVKLRNPDFGLFAAAVGAHHELIGENIEMAVHDAIGHGGVVVLEVPVGDTIRIVRKAAVSRVKAVTRRAIGQRFINRMKRLLIRD